MGFNLLTVNKMTCCLYSKNYLSVKMYPVICCNFNAMCNSEMSMYVYVYV